MKNLSEQDQNIRHKAEQCKEQEKAKQLRKKRKEINKKINKLIKTQQEQEFEEMLIDIENRKEDSNKCSEAQRRFKNRKSKKN